jgi:hypothetical protein
MRTSPNPVTVKTEGSFSVADCPWAGKAKKVDTIKTSAVLLAIRPPARRKVFKGHLSFSVTKIVSPISVLGWS